MKEKVDLFFEKRKGHLLLFCWLICFSAATFFYRGVLLPLVSNFPTDFRGCFYPSVKLAFSHESLYNSPNYLYPPFFLALIAPFAFMNIGLAERIWFFFLLILLGGSLYLLMASFSRKTPLFWALAFFIFSHFEPLYVELSYLQADLVVLFTIVVAYRLEQKGLPFWAGVSLAVGSLIKISPIFFVLYFIVSKKWKATAGFVGGLLFFSALTLPFVGWQGWSDFFRFGFPNLLENSAGNRLDQSFTNLLLHLREMAAPSEKIRKSFIWIRVGSLLFAALILFSLWNSLRKRTGKRSLGLEYASVICAMLLCATTMNETHLVLLLFPFFMLAYFLFYQFEKKAVVIFITGVAFTLIGLQYGYTTYSFDNFLLGAFLAKTKFFGTCLIYFCCLVLLGTES